jgi:hypothetical protein
MASAAAMFALRRIMLGWTGRAPAKGRIEKRKTNYLQIIISPLQRTAGPYRSASSGFKSYDYRRPSAAKFGADAGGTLGRRARNAV